MTVSRPPCPEHRSANAPTLSSHPRVRVQLAKLRQSIQVLCRSTAPLAKILDYVQEDTDTMRKEHDTWVKEAQAHTSVLVDDSGSRLTSLHPLQAQLRDLDQQVGQHEEMVRALKASTLDNEARIQRLVASVAIRAK